MTIYRYPLRAVVGDYVRSGVGLALTAGPGAMVSAGSTAQYLLLALAVLFAAFAVRTGRRHVARIELTDERLSLFEPGRVSLEASNIQSVKLSYYSTKSDRAGGWMQLTLKGDGGPRGGTIRIDSSLDGFSEVARWAARAAQSNRLVLSRATIANLSALGVDIGRSD
jgi:hypothetical protein